MKAIAGVATPAWFPFGPSIIPGDPGGSHGVRRSRAPFVISDASETDVETDRRLSAILELGAGVLVLGLWTLYVLGQLHLPA